MTIIAPAFVCAFCYFASFDSDVVFTAILSVCLLMCSFVSGISHKIIDFKNKIWRIDYGSDLEHFQAFPVIFI